MADQHGLSPCKPPETPTEVLEAAALLGWQGVPLPEVELLGCRVLPVVRVDEVVHRARTACGDGPQRDGDVLEIWEWPQAADHVPGAPLALSGILVRARSSRRGLVTARTWRGFGPAAVLTGPDVLNEASRLEFQLTGVGLVTVADHTLGLEVPAASGRQPPARRRGLDRWVEESLYAHAVGVGLLTTDVTDCHDRLDVYQHDEARWAPWPVHPDQLMLPLADDPTPDVCIADRRGRRERVQRRQGVWR